MTEFTVDESPDNSGTEAVAEVVDWQSALADMQTAAPEPLKPVFSRAIPPENRSPENNRGLSADMSVATSAGVVTAPRIDFHRVNWYSVITLALQRSSVSADRQAATKEALTVTMPNPDAPKGSVIYTRFTGINPEGLTFKPGDKEFEGFKERLLRTVKTAKVL